MSFWSGVAAWLGLVPREGRPRTAPRRGQGSRGRPARAAGPSPLLRSDSEPGPEPEPGDRDGDRDGEGALAAEPAAQEHRESLDSAARAADEEPGAVLRQEREDFLAQHAAPSAPSHGAAPASAIGAALPKRGGISRFDHEEAMTVILEGPEEEILWAIARRIERGRLDLPTLPSTSMAVIDLANNPGVEFQELVSRISADPVLSSELLRTANSVLYASEEPVDTLHAAIVRIGLRSLRSMIFSVSMRGTILRSGTLSDYAEDVWRQAHSVATVARAIAPVVGFDPEKAFLLGLLHDIGKIALLAMLSREIKDPRDCTAALVGRVFQAYHQEAGAAMARKWRLPAEFVAVAGCHHAWETNENFTRSAALAHLAHHLDLALSMGDRRFWAGMAALPALSYLAPQPEQRERILALAEAAHNDAPVVG